MNRRSARRVAVAAAAVGLLAAACGGGSDPEATSPSSTDAASSSAPTTAVPTTVPATTLPPPTTAEFIPDTDDGRPFLELDLDEKIDAFLAAPNSIFAANIAAEMGLSGEVRYGPWLLDILRVVASSETTLTAVRALQDLSGIPATGESVGDFAQYGAWVRSNPVDPGPGYEIFKTTLYSEIQPEYGPWLDDVDDIERLAGISWGGVRRGGIPELNDPVRISVAEADFMEPDELVLGVVVNDVAVAYPLRFLARHEMANDRIDGIPVTLAYCTLCRTGIMFDGRVGDRELTFQTSGLLIDSNKVMIDNETESLWHHLAGEAISGPQKGTELATFPLVTTRWSDWVAEHPDTETLDTPPATFFPGQPERQPIAYDYTPGAAYSLYYDSEGVWFPIVEPTDVFERKANVLTIELDGVALALGLDATAGEPPFVVDVGDRRVLVVPNDGGARMFDATGTGLTAGDQPALAPDGVQPAEAVLASGEALPRLVSGQSFWFAWFGQHPDTETWTG